MSKLTDFYPVTVKAIEKTTPDCSIISLDIPGDLSDLFAYKQGQYLTLKAEINGEEVRRSYSLCSSPLDSEWKIGVKKIDGGRFSTFANDILQPGMQVEVMPPNGRFFVETDPQQDRQYVAFAAGSGITPIMSILKTHLQAEPGATFKLFYINSSVASTILKEGLEALKNQYMDRVEIFYFLTREQRSAPLFNGRLSEEKLEVIFRSICQPEEINDYFICGPEAMIFMVRDFLMEKGVDKKKVHFELFNTSGTQQKAAVKTVAKADGKQAEIELIEGGKTVKFHMSRDQNILDAALQQGADLPFACKGGVCCTCRAKLVEGEVNMLVNYALEEEEVEAGFILTCQALPTSDKIKVDFDV